MEKKCKTADRTTSLPSRSRILKQLKKSQYFTSALADFILSEVQYVQPMLHVANADATTPLPSLTPPEKDEEARRDWCPNSHFDNIPPCMTMISLYCRTKRMTNSTGLVSWDGKATFDVQVSQCGGAKGEGKIFIKTSYGKIIPIDVVGDDTILSIKQKIQNKEGLEVDEQILVRGVVLENNKTLSSYGITPANTTASSPLILKIDRSIQRNPEGVRLNADLIVRTYATIMLLNLYIAHAKLEPEEAFPSDLYKNFNRNLIINSIHYTIGRSSTDAKLEDKKALLKKALARNDFAEATRLANILKQKPQRKSLAAAFKEYPNQLKKYEKTGGYLFDYLTPQLRHMGVLVGDVGIGSTLIESMINDTLSEQNTVIRKLEQKVDKSLQELSHNKIMSGGSKRTQRKKKKRWRCKKKRTRHRRKKKKPRTRKRKYKRRKTRKHKN